MKMIRERNSTPIKNEENLLLKDSDYSLLKNAIREIKELRKRESKYIKDIETLLEEQYNNGDKKRIKEAVDNLIVVAEKDFLKIRNIKNHINCNDETEDYNNKSCESFNKKSLFSYKINKENIVFRMPLLCSKQYPVKSRSENEQDNFIKYFIKKMALEIKNMDKIESDFIKNIEEFTIIFIHHFNENSLSKDTDNLDIKKPIDGINGVLIKNDSINLSHIVQITMEDNDEFTEMFLVPSHNIGKNILDILLR